MTEKEFEKQLKWWNPYSVGIGIGILSWFTFVLVDKPIGISTTIAKISGAILGVFTGKESLLAMPYWEKYPPGFDYGLVFVICVFFGALIRDIAREPFHIEKVPPLWANRFGNSVVKRGIAAFAGGFLVLFGARLAGGCTSGHGISGTLQLATSGWIFFASVLLSGIVTATLLFPKRSHTN